MSITDELRKWAKVFECVWFKPASKEVVITTGGSMPVDHVNMRLFIEGIADRIDEEHERVRAESIIDMTDDAMAEHGWVRLPKDADGEYIHIGDVMEWPNGETFEVVGIGDGTLFYVEGDGDALADWTGASTKRHYHAPTVEDVVTDLCEHVWETALLGGTWSDSPVESYIADFAKRLRLAKEDE